MQTDSSISRYELLYAKFCRKLQEKNLLRELPTSFPPFRHPSLHQEALLHDTAPPIPSSRRRPGPSTTKTLSQLQLGSSLEIGQKDPFGESLVVLDPGLRRDDGSSGYLSHATKLPDEGWDDRRGRSTIDFSSSDHLGLQQHPRVIAQSRECLEKYGAGSGGSRLLAGNLPIFSDLEQNIARAKGTESSIIFNSAYQANTSIIPALLDKMNPVVFADRLVHASMHAGFDEARVDQIRYKHLDMNHLEDLLKEHKSATAKFIFSETVFGMDGDQVDLSHISFLAEKYGAFLYLDEAHSIGMAGEHGYGVSLDNGICIGAFSKTLGSCGGFASCSNILKSYLINKCKSFIYSTSLPPAVIGANLASWELLPTFENERKLIAKNAILLREKLRANGFNIGNSSTHIIPIIIGSAKDTLSAAAYLKENGILVSAIRPPSVPPNTSRLRISISAHHKEDDMEKLVQLLVAHRRTSLYNPDIGRKKYLFA